MEVNKVAEMEGRDDVTRAVRGIGRNLLQTHEYRDVDSVHGAGRVALGKCSAAKGHPKRLLAQNSAIWRFRGSFFCFESHRHRAPEWDANDNVLEWP